MRELTKPPVAAPATDGKPFPEVFERVVGRAGRPLGWMWDKGFRFLFLLDPMTEEDRRAQEERRHKEQQQIFEAASRSAAGSAARIKTIKRESAKVGRNDPCPCGSGKKYKKCHGAAA